MEKIHPSGKSPREESLKTEKKKERKKKRQEGKEQRVFVNLFIYLLRSMTRLAVHAVPHPSEIIKEVGG